MLLAARTDTGILGEIVDNTFLKALNQCAFAAFSIFKQLSFALAAKNIDSASWAFFIGFCHLYLFTPSMQLRLMSSRKMFI